jgi:N-acetylmuramoyl-L-alanine amidase
MRKILSIIVHQSASNNPNHDDIEVIRDWHVRERGFNDVGYHYFIKKDGTIQKGRPDEIPGAHCRGQNINSIGICLSGLGVKTPEQLEALKGLLKTLCDKHFLSQYDIKPHYDFALTQCPGFNLQEWIAGVDWE